MNQTREDEDLLNDVKLQGNDEDDELKPHWMRYQPSLKIFAKNANRRSNNSIDESFINSKTILKKKAYSSNKFSSNSFFAQASLENLQKKRKRDMEVATEMVEEEIIEAVDPSCLDFLCSNAVDKTTSTSKRKKFRYTSNSIVEAASLFSSFSVENK